MTSTAKIEANRANGRRSAGPKTAAGKARASKNALRHGLNTPIEADHPQLAIIAAWALRFSHGPYIPTKPARARFPPKWVRFGDEEARQLRKGRAFPGSCEPGKALAAAIAQAELNRVRAAKATALRLAAEAAEAAYAGEPAPKATLTAQALIASLPDLMKLDEYERKARSKRDKTFRRLI